ncbi:type II secretion system F family protein [Pseudomonas sp. AA-38]|uniref:type II secretion system F family protein n=1 Tax=Pseudomonas sp. AA-38 TaxID=3028807 RepID=UPI0023F7B55E|nr:type II secretion system F family protein [Pseudomonas sp. AA-38]
MSERALPLQARARLFAHLAAMERAGVPLDRALASLALGARQARALQRLRQLVGAGRDLAVSGQLSGVFTPLEASLLRAAQQAGGLAQMHEQLAQRYAEQVQQLAALRARLWLPAGVLLLALIVQPLPALVGGSLSLAGYLACALLPLLSLFGLYRLVPVAWRRWQQRRSVQPGRLDDFLLALPLLGTLQRKADLRNFCDALGLQLEAGIAVLDALPRACGTMSNARLRRDFATLAPRIQAGQSLTQALIALSLPGQGMLTAMLNSGEATGRPGEALLRFARLQAQQLAARQQWLAVWLPRLFYLAVAGWMAYSLIDSGAFIPRLPAELAGR